MRQIFLLAAAVAFIAVGGAVWFNLGTQHSTPEQPSSISTQDLHLKADVQKLPAQTIDEIN
jgi:hypothetical protein